MTDHELYAMLQLHTISRWQIVEVTRPQSVPEHSFRVWALLSDLYDDLFVVEHNSLDREAMARLALVHDVDESVTGDIPATVKDTLEDISPGIMGKLQMRIHREFPTISGWMRGQQRTSGYYLLKIADNVEAILYMQQYGIYKAGAAGCRDLIIDTRLEALEKILAHVEKTFHAIEWARARQWITKVTRCEMGLRGGVLGGLDRQLGSGEGP